MDQSYRSIRLLPSFRPNCLLWNYLVEILSYQPFSYLPFSLFLLLAFFRTKTFIDFISNIYILYKYLAENPLFTNDHKSLSFSQQPLHITRHPWSDLQDVFQCPQASLWIFFKSLIFSPTNYIQFFLHPPFFNISRIHQITFSVQHSYLHSALLISACVKLTLSVCSYRILHCVCPFVLSFSIFHTESCERHSGRFCESQSFIFFEKMLWTIRFGLLVLTSCFCCCSKYRTRSAIYH